MRKLFDIITEEESQVTSDNSTQQTDSNSAEQQNAAQSEQGKAEQQGKLQQLVQMQENINTYESERDAKKRQLDAEYNNKTRQLDTEYGAKIENIKKQMQMIRMGLASVGVDATKNESNRPTYRFSKKLFESVPFNRTEPMFAVFALTRDNLDLSYRLEDTKCRTYSRRLIEHLNKMQKTWLYDTESHWDDGTEDSVKAVLRSILTKGIKRGTISYSDKELELFIDEFGRVLASNPVFSWIFGTNK